MARSSFGGLMTAGVLSALAVKAIKKKSKTVKEENPIVRLDNNIYLMDFNSDYQLDKMLEQGVSSIVDMVKFVCLNAGKSINSVKPGTDIGAGCTTFDTFTPQGEHIFARNFDFKTSPCFLVWTHPENHYASISVVDNNFLAFGSNINQFSDNRAVQALLAPYCCVDGINEKGLSIAVLQIRAKATCQKDPNKKDITTTSMIRAVLDTCATVDEAVNLIASYNMHDSLFTNYHYQIVDNTGRTVVVEYIDNMMSVYERNGEKYNINGSVYENDNCSGLYVSNFSIKKEIGSFEAEQHGQDRIAAVKNALNDCNNQMSELEAMDLLSYVKLDYDHPKYPWRIGALWSAVYNTEQKTVKLVAGMDYTKIYTFSVFKPLEVLKQESITDSAYEPIEWEYL